MTSLKVETWTRAQLEDYLWNCVHKSQQATYGLVLFMAGVREQPIEKLRGMVAAFAEREERLEKMRLARASRRNDGHEHTTTRGAR